MIIHLSPHRSTFHWGLMIMYHYRIYLASRPIKQQVMIKYELKTQKLELKNFFFVEYSFFVIIICCKIVTHVLSITFLLKIWLGCDGKKENFHKSWNTWKSKFNYSCTACTYSVVILVSFFLFNNTESPWWLQLEFFIVSTN